MKQAILRNIFGAAINQYFNRETIGGTSRGRPHTNGCPPLPRSSKPSGVAQAKRDAVKRRNIRKNG